MTGFWSRFAAIAIKELTQLRRDRLTFGMVIGIPVLQLVLFGYAINADPKHLPLVLVDNDHSQLARSFTAALKNTGYFDLVGAAPTERDADELLAKGDVQFALTIPAGFERKVLRGERPALLVEADATDPAATGNAIAAIQALVPTVFAHDLRGPLAGLAAGAAPFEVRTHRRYNPEGITAYNIVPGLVGTILTMTMVLMTALAVTRERERGTMESLLATPVRPIEVMIGKIAPYIGIGLVQATLILFFARVLFDVPMAGGLALLYAVVVLFIAATLAVGLTFSIVARNQLQAMQMTFFFFLPSILLSGFMFPFRGMPSWAQWLGDLLPLTHFLRAVRGILLKGNGFVDTLPHLWPLAVFMIAVMAIGMRLYRGTLD
jgi:ABC-2 type transport system permease protein